MFGLGGNNNNLKDLLVPKGDCAAYKDALETYRQSTKAESYKKADKNNYDNALLTAARLAAECWDKFDIKDKRMQLKDSVKGNDEVQSLEKKVLGVVSQLNAIAKDYVQATKKNQLSKASAAAQALIDSGMLDKGAVEQLKAEIKADSANTVVQVIGGEDLNKAKAQIATLADKVKELKVAIGDIKKDKGTKDTLNAMKRLCDEVATRNGNLNNQGRKH